MNLTPVIEGTYDRSIDLNHEMNFMTSLPGRVRVRVRVRVS